MSAMDPGFVLTREVQRGGGTRSFRTASPVATALMIGVLAFNFGRAAESPADLFEEALTQETGERNLSKALELYRDVLGGLPASDPLRARCYLQMGTCLEKMGDAKWEDALQAYRSVLRVEGFVSPEVLHIAESRLAHLIEMIEENKTKSVISTPEVPRPLGWMMALDVGKSGSDGKVTWLSLGRGISSDWMVGSEIGYLSKKREPLAFADNVLTSLYLGPYLEGRMKGGTRFSIAFRGGVGVIYSREEIVDVRYDLSGQNGSIPPWSRSVSNHEFVNAGLAFMLTFDYRIYRGVSVRIGMRPVDIRFTDNGYGGGGLFNSFNCGAGVQF